MTTMKQCSQCGIEKPATLEYFHFNRSTKDRLVGKCKECIKEYRAKYRVENAIRERDQQRKYYRENRAYVLEVKRQWRSENYDKEVARKKSRKSRKEALPCNFTEDDKKRALKYFNGRCAVCGRPLNDLFGEHIGVFDHWIPVSDMRDDNPGTVPTNMLPLCNGIDGCNNKKHDRDPDEFLTTDFGPRKAREIMKRITAYFGQIEEASVYVFRGKPHDSED